MFKTAKDFEKAMYNVLVNYINDKYTVELFDFDISKGDFIEINSHLIDCRYIIGVTKTNNASHPFSSLNDPHVTYSGLKYMEAYEHNNI